MIVSPCILTAKQNIKELPGWIYLKKKWNMKNNSDPAINYQLENAASVK